MRETEDLMEPRQQVASTVFSTWVIVGLFLDGWAHNAELSETFWTPWHAVLYSGFIAAGIHFVVQRRRRRRAGLTTSSDPLVLAGFVTFGAAGVGDAIWHTIFGVEEDVAALLSPTHLALMIGGLLLITGPLRGEASRTLGRSWRGAVPPVAAITLSLSLVAFFLQFASPFHVTHHAHFGPTGGEDAHLLGLTGLLLTNGLFMAAIAWTLTRTARPPRGTFTVVLGGTALLLSSLLAFDNVALAVAAVAAGATADVLARAGRGRRLILMATPAVLWIAWSGIYHAVWGLGWPVEYWTGATVLSVLTGWAIDALVRTADTVPAAAPEASSDGLLPREVDEIPTGGRGAPTTVTGG